MILVYRLARWEIPKEPKFRMVALGTTILEELRIESSQPPKKDNPKPASMDTRKSTQ